MCTYILCVRNRTVSDTNGPGWHGILRQPSLIVTCYKPKTETQRAEATASSATRNDAEMEFYVPQVCVGALFPGKKENLGPTVMTYLGSYWLLPKGANGLWQFCWWYRTTWNLKVVGDSWSVFEDMPSLTGRVTRVKNLSMWVSEALCCAPEVTSSDSWVP